MNLDDVLAELWNEHAAALANDAHVLARCSPDSDLSDVLASAHRLAGSLPMFGLRDSGDLAATIEELLIARRGDAADTERIASLGALIASDIQRRRTDDGPDRGR